MRVLLICYECSPYIGSEWAVGWGRLLGAAAVADTTVVTSAANFAHLQRAQGEGLVPANVHFCTPEPDEKLRSLEQRTGTYAYNYRAYRHWHALAFRLIQKLHAREPFDLVHQVNVCTFREPGLCLDLQIPFLWGPIGGTQNYPVRFLPALSLREAVKESVRTVANRMTLRKRRIRSAARRATVLMAANTTNHRDFKKAFGRPVERLLETGLHAVAQTDRTRFERRIHRHMAGLAPEPLRLLWSGELHTRKALPILLRSLARLGPDTPWLLDVLGDGPMRAQWEAQVERLGLQDRVSFHGWKAFPEAVAAFQDADVLCFPSLRDTSGNVVLEALAAGVPVVCFDHQGCGDIVDATCGIKLPVRSPARAYQDWADALEELATTPGRLLELSYGASLRAQEFLWSHNQARVNELYRRMTGAVESDDRCPTVQAVDAATPMVEV